MKRNRMIPLLLVLLMLIGAMATITQTPAQAITPAQTDPLPEKAYLPLVVRSRPTVKIATHFPLSGSLGREGVSMRNAAELSLEQQAAALRERGFEVALAVYDDAGSPELAQRNAARSSLIRRSCASMGISRPMRPSLLCPCMRVLIYRWSHPQIPRRK